MALMRFSFLIFVAVFLVALPAQADPRLEDEPEMAYRQSYMVNPEYNAMAREALAYKPPRFDFMRFRSLYSRTRQYDPIGTQILAQMNDLAYIALNDPDPERAEGALFAYKTLVSNHLAHIDVVMQALSLTEQDKRFGKPEFFEWMKEGLIKTVVISGDGYTLQGAYDVITLSEETILFHRLGLQLVKTQAAREGVIYYTMHDVVDVETGEDRAVFVNTSIPMRYLEALKDIQNRALRVDLRR